MTNDSEALATGQQVITACALIHKNDNGVPKVFLARRAKSKKFLPDVFEVPGGHIDFGEDLVAGLKREIQEEFSMNIQVGSPFASFTYVNHIKKSHSVEIMYFARFINNESEIKLNPADHSEFKWVSLEDLSQAYTEQKNENDEEFVCLRKGLEMLSGAQPDYA